MATRSGLFFFFRVSLDHWGELFSRAPPSLSFRKKMNGFPPPQSFFPLCFYSPSMERNYRFFLPPPLRWEKASSSQGDRKPQWIHPGNFFLPLLSCDRLRASPILPLTLLYAFGKTETSDSFSLFFSNEGDTNPLFPLLPFFLDKK